MATDHEASPPMKVVIGLGVFTMSVFWFCVRTVCLVIVLGMITDPILRFIVSHYNITMSLDLQKQIFFGSVFVISLIVHIVGGIFRDNYKVYQIRAGIIEGTIYYDHSSLDGPMALQALADGDHTKYMMYKSSGM